MNYDAWPSHSGNMFSSILPGVPTNMTFMPNPPSKPSNRYVKSPTNPNVSYLSNPSLYDLGYLSIPPAEGPPAAWYPNSSYNLPYGQDYAIYATPASNTFNYDQSTQFLDSHDNTSFADSPVSPSMSNDDCQSTISELEVEERDRIAKMNAEYNAISHAGSLSDSPSPPTYSPDRFRESNPTFQLSSQTCSYLPLSVSQPRHPDLHFPHRQIGNEKKESSSSSYRIYASPVVSIPQALSPPSVERLSSQLPLEQNVITNSTLPQPPSTPPVNSRNHDGTSNLDRPRIIHNGISSSTSSIYSSTQTGHPSSVGQSYISGVEGSQMLEPSSIVPEEITHKPSVVIANGHSPPTLPSDVQENVQNKRRSPPGAPMLIQAPSTTANNHPPPPYSNNSPDSRQHMDVVTALPHAQINEATELECTERIPLGTTLRRDTKTPGLSNRGLSNTQPDFESPLTSSPDAHSSPDMRDKAAHKLSPKGFLDEKSGNLDNGRSPPDSLSSNDSSCSSVSPSHRPLHHENVSRLKTKDADYDKEFERHRRQRSTGTERTAPVPKSTDQTSRGTAPLHTQGPLHLSSEGALATFPQSGPQVVSIVTSSEHRPTDLRHSKTVQETLIPFDSRDSRNIHDRQYVNFAKPQWEITKHERNDMRILSTDLRSSPVNKFQTSSSLPSKVTLDFPPTPPEPHRRHSDGDQVGPPVRPSLTGRNSAPLVRSVRWTENLVAPSPILTPPRRKGWFNRRGEQLWTNNGDYRPPRSGEDYPLDLDDYPEPGEGWMNEDGVRIDMNHCRIPKALPRPVLKKP